MKKIHPKISFYSLSHVVIDVYRVYVRTISFFFGTHPQFIFALYFNTFDCYPIPSPPYRIYCVLYWLWCHPHLICFSSTFPWGWQNTKMCYWKLRDYLARLFSFQSKDYDMLYWFKHSSPFTLLFITILHTIIGTLFVEKYEIFFFFYNY